MAKFRFLRGAELLQTQRDTLTALARSNRGGGHDVKISFFGGLNFGRLKDPERTPDGVLEVASIDDLLAHKLKVILQRVEINNDPSLSTLSSQVKQRMVDATATVQTIPRVSIKSNLLSLNEGHLANV